MNRLIHILTGLVIVKLMDESRPCFQGGYLSLFSPSQNISAPGSGAQTHKFVDQPRTNSPHKLLGVEGHASGMWGFSSICQVQMTEKATTVFFLNKQLGASCNPSAQNPCVGSELLNWQYCCPSAFARCGVLYQKVISDKPPAETSCPWSDSMASIPEMTGSYLRLQKTESITISVLGLVMPDFVIETLAFLRISVLHTHFP